MNNALHTISSPTSLPQELLIVSFPWLNDHFFHRPFFPSTMIPFKATKLSILPILLAPYFLFSRKDIFSFPNISIYNFDDLNYLSCLSFSSLLFGVYASAMSSWYPSTVSSTSSLSFAFYLYSSLQLHSEIISLRHISPKIGPLAIVPSPEIQSFHLEESLNFGRALLLGKLS